MTTDTKTKRVRKFHRRPGRKRDLTHAAVRVRFFSNVPTGLDAESCWEWQGQLNIAGYGAFSLNKRTELAHRISLAYAQGRREPIRGKVVMHMCDNRQCVNPAHLRLMSQSENMKDANQKGRVRRARLNGEENGSSKLTAEDVDAIRSEYKARAVPYSALARRFGVGVSTIHRIVTRQAWAHR